MHLILVSATLRPREARQYMDDQKDIASFRKAIDQLDDDLLRLLNERSKNVVEIGKLKKSAEANAHLHTPRREA